MFVSHVMFLYETGPIQWITVATDDLLNQGSSIYSADYAPMRFQSYKG